MSLSHIEYRYLDFPGGHTRVCVSFECIHRLGLLLSLYRHKCNLESVQPVK